MKTAVFNCTWIASFHQIWIFWIIFQTLLKLKQFILYSSLNYITIYYIILLYYFSLWNSSFVSKLELFFHETLAPSKSYSSHWWYAPLAPESSSRASSGLSRADDPGRWLCNRTETRIPLQRAIIIIVFFNAFQRCYFRLTWATRPSKPSTGSTSCYATRNRWTQSSPIASSRWFNSCLTWLSFTGAGTRKVNHWAHVTTTSTSWRLPQNVRSSDLLLNCETTRNMEEVPAALLHAEEFACDSIESSTAFTSD